MQRIFAMMAVALALAAAPAVAVAERPTKAMVGAAFIEENNRVTVAAVLRGGSGDQMGLRPGDVITHAGGQRISSQRRLTAYIRRLSVGDAVELTVKRGRQSLQLTGTAMARVRWGG